MKKNDKKQENSTPSVTENDAQPENAFDIVNFYGTYNIQPTQASENTYPAIGQGLDRKTAARLENESRRWNKEDSKEPQRPGN